MNGRRRTAVRLSGRQLTTAAFVAAACVVLWWSSLLLPSWLPSPRVAAAAEGSPPSLAQLNLALARADGALHGLYKPLSRSSAVMSEHYAFPLRVYLTRYQTWLLAGRERAVASPVESAFDGERFSVDFRSPRRRHSPRLDVVVNWNASPSEYSIEIVNARFDDASTSADVYLDDIYMGRFGRPNLGVSLRRRFAKEDVGHLRSLRYTIRHATQEARNYFAYRSEPRKSAKLANVIRRAGFAVNYDITAPIWTAGTSYADDMPYQLDAYHDCNAALPTSSRSYPYRSKVCLGRALYVWVSHSDTLARSAQALHVLNKYADPHKTVRDQRFPLGLPVGWDPRASMPRNETPIKIARDLETRFRQQGAGIPACVFASYCSSGASGIRTFEFGALETLLGYRFRDRVATSYADAVARIALAVQVRDDGIVRTHDQTYYRPAAVGSFYLNWDRARRLSVAPPVVGWSLVRRLHLDVNTTTEYPGVIPSNAETTLTAYAFLVHYRCHRYGVGCGSSSAGVPTSAARHYTREDGSAPWSDR